MFEFWIHSLFPLFWVSNAFNTYMCNRLLILLFRIVSVYGIINNRTKEKKARLEISCFSAAAAATTTIVVVLLSL